MSVLCWNVEGLTLAKTTCDDFISFLSNYKIICLLETWTKKSSKIEIDGYKTLTHSYRKLVNRRAKRAGGGIIIYVRDEIHKGVKLINNELDCIVWLKLDRYYFGLNEDIYLGVTYIVPENSPIHSVYDIDLFDRLEEDIMLYSTKGSVFVTGDFNSRTGTKSDYVDNAYGRSDDELNIVEIPFIRASADKTTNRFGDRLLEMCKATNICIVNGRLYGDANVGTYTCMTANGESLIDYLLTAYTNFNILTDFNVLHFNEYSNHSPLTFTIKIPEYDERETTYEWQSFHWSDEHKNIFRNRLNENMSTFAEHITNSDANTCTQERINELTANVTNRINSAAGNLFTKIHKTSSIPKFSHISKLKQDRKIWYDDQCKAKKSFVKAAVRAYNSEHNRENRESVFKARTQASV